MQTSSAIRFFVEPCGENTEEMYLQGASTSLPEDVQLKLYRSIKGLENVHIMRTAYAIEYDCVDPLALKATLEVKDKPGLFGAGQFNGSSGYEEAAAQGLVAGINAALKIKGKGEFVLLRSQSYIGTLIDDLVTRDVRSLQDDDLAIGIPACLSSRTTPRNGCLKRATVLDL